LGQNHGIKPCGQIPRCSKRRRLSCREQARLGKVFGGEASEISPVGRKFGGRNLRGYPQGAQAPEVAYPRVCPNPFGMSQSWQARRGLIPNGGSSWVSKPSEGKTMDSESLWGGSKVRMSGMQSLEVSNPVRRSLENQTWV
jgi:hypothetical protein